MPVDIADVQEAMGKVLDATYVDAMFVAQPVCCVCGKKTGGVWMVGLTRNRHHELTYCGAHGVMVHEEIEQGPSFQGLAHAFQSTKEAS